MRLKRRQRGISSLTTVFTVCAADTSARYTDNRMGRFAHRCLSNSLLTGLLFAALAIRALIPVGFMPVAGAGGSLSFQLCAPRSSEAPAAPLGKDGQRAPSSPSHQIPCLYSLSGTPAPSPWIASLPLSMERPSEIPQPIGRAGVIPSIRRAQAPRAPPSSI